LLLLFILLHVELLNMR